MKDTKVITAKLYFKLINGNQGQIFKGNNPSHIFCKMKKIFEDFIWTPFWVTLIRHLALWCCLNLVLDMLVNVSVTHPATRKKMAKFLFSWVKWCSGKYCYICSAYISVKIHGCSVFRLFTCPQWCQTSDVYSVPIIILTLLQRITPRKRMEDTVLVIELDFVSVSL